MIQSCCFSREQRVDVNHVTPSVFLDGSIRSSNYSSGIPAYRHNDDLRLRVSAGF